MKSSNLGKTIMVALLFGLCLASLLAIRSVVEPRVVAGSQAELITAQKADPITPEERTAEKAFTAISAVAISGDVAQVAIVKSFTSTVWAFVVGLVLVAMIVYMLKYKQQKYTGVTAEDFADEAVRNQSRTH